MPVNANPIAISTLPDMIANREFLPALMAAGLSDFDRIYHHHGGEVIKQIRTRQVTRIGISRASGTCDLYLKRHVANRPTFSEWVEGTIRHTGVSPGILEFHSICDFRKHGIPTATPVAAGERKAAGFRYESFLITESITPYISLETIIRHHPERLQGIKGERLKQVILKAIADLSRQMHDAGINHLDFNADHVMIGPEVKDGNVSLALLDFQRIDRKKWMRFRWMIKTMAELFYSMPDPVFSDQDRQSMFKHYVRRSGNGAWDRFLLQWIKRKARRIGRHTENIFSRQKNAPREKK